MVLEYGEHTVERVSRSRVVLAPKRPTPAELQNVIRPSEMTETLLDYPAPQAVNISHLVKNQAETSTTKAVDKHSTTTAVVDATSSPQDSNQEALSNTTQEDGRRLTEDDKTENVVESSPNSTVEAPTSKQDERKNSEDKEFFIDTIVSHKQDDRRRVRKARHRTVLYRVRWRGYPRMTTGGNRSRTSPGAT